MIIRRAPILALALTLSSSFGLAQTVDRTPAGAMVGAINAERARSSLTALTEDPRLDAIAEAHSLEMARSRFFSHVSPTTGQPADRVSRAGLHWTAVAENIAINQSPEDAQQALLRSPGHHENMVDPIQRSVGIGVVRHGEQVWVTQLFATLTDAPLPAAGPATVVPAHPAAIAAPSVAADDEVDDGEGDEDARDDVPAVAPVAPAAPLPTVPTALPWQGVPGLEQFLTGLGLAAQPAAPASPPMRAGRAAPAHAAATAPLVYMIQTPFGPLRVEVPGSGAAPATATPTAPARPSAARPAPARRAPHVPRPAPPRGRVIEVDTLDV